MPYWWEKYDEVPDNNNSAPPDGAPEGHFPDQVNNIQRQALAAIREAFALILKPTAAAGPITDLPGPTANEALADTFRQRIYDDQWPVGSIRAWVGGSGNALTAPTGITATWQICDGTNSTPNLLRKVIGGADPENATPVFTGDVLGSNDTSEVEQGVTVEDTTLVLNQIPAHVHGGETDGHTHRIEWQRRTDVGVNGSEAVTRLVETGGNQGLNDAAQTKTDTFTTDPTGGDVNGDTQPHGHTVTTGAHKHTIDPQRTCLEFYMRTA